jgi:hypothetical protein
MTEKAYTNRAARMGDGDSDDERLVMLDQCSRIELMLSARLTFVFFYYWVIYY